MMESKLDSTINYYNSKATEYVDSTIAADMSAMYNRFEKYLSSGNKILDCGCGSGRDTKYFLAQGYDVVAIDGSKELCEKASEYTGIEVRNLYFQDIDYVNEFDGIWACASLLHLHMDELPEVLHRLLVALKDNGCIYMSFKYGEGELERDGRFFTYLDEERMKDLLAEIPELQIEEMFVTGNVMNRANEKWLNVIVKK